MYEAGICFIFAYLIGTLNPAAFIATIKKKNLRESGTGNLGATNVTLALGKTYGLIVMIFDVAKAYLSVKIAKMLFPQLVFAGLVAGLGSVVGHIFPFYMRFRGGKGLAPFGGMILAYSPQIFIALLSCGIMLALITDYPIALTFSSITIAPIVVGIIHKDIISACIILLATILVFFKHLENIGNIRTGKETKLSTYLHKAKNT